MAVLKYNGITLGPLLYTDQYDQEVVDDDSGTDTLYWKITIGVTCYLSAPLSSQYGGSNETPMASMNRLRAALLQKRAGSNTATGGATGSPLSLSFKVNNVEILPNAAGNPNFAAFAQSNPGLDFKGGPFPQYCNIAKLTEATFMVKYKIITYRLEPVQTTAVPTSTQVGSNYNGILSSRWRDEVTIDQNFYSTRTRTGKIVIDPGARVALDALRKTLAMTGIDAGFLRESSNYYIAEDGCSMGYVLRDKEQFLMPPGGNSLVTKASGWYGESSTLQGGAFRTAQCSVKLEGPKNADKASLIVFALNMVQQKMIAAGKNSKAYPYLNFAIREDMYANAVEVTASCRLPPNSQRTTGVVANLKAFASPPYQADPGTPPPNPGDRGTGNVLLNAAAYWDPFAATYQLNTQFNNYPNNQLVPGSGNA